MTRSFPRLHVDQPLAAGKPVLFNREQVHYLRNVLRLDDDSSVLVFNGREGEWRADQLSLKQKNPKGTITIKTREQPTLDGPDLYFTPVKKAGTDFIAAKGTELGARSLNPVITDFSSTMRVNQERIKANAREAAEQCGRLDVPNIGNLRQLTDVLGTWPDTRILIMADETRKTPNVLKALDVINLEDGPPAFLIGPQGGFSETELVFLRGLPFVKTIGLGPRILRSETAVIAILTCWQATRGDWT